MELGIGLPATVPDVERGSLLDWSRKSEENGFSSLGVVDRIVYPNYEPLISLTAAAAVTERIRIATTVLLGPLRTNTALLAKELATLDNLSEGRLVLGIGLGAREDDYTASGLEPKRRGAILDRQLEDMKRVWAGEGLGDADPIGPPPARQGGPVILIGGGADASARRAARFGDGWIAPGGPPEQFKGMPDKVDAAWAEAGRPGKPRKAALAYFSLGPRAEENANTYLHHYYAWLGDEVAGMIVGGAAISEQMVKAYVQAFDDSGCDELFMFPCSTDVEQVDLLAEAAGL
jgi:alkanesulfonate monooxygenase SsuD/methylene tetrahydromethanopterin reductase-like flavin-dependent oxidoreductase (luciferase family)